MRVSEIRVKRIRVNQGLGVAKKKTPSALERLCVPEDKCSALRPQFLP